MKTNLRNQKGFTLIELVVVMVILALLAAVAVPKFLDLQKQAEVAAVKKVVGNIRSALSIRVAKALINGDDLTSLAGSLYPMDLLANIPEPYRGRTGGVPTEKGVWFEGSTSHDLYYVMKNIDIVSDPTNVAYLRYEIEVVQEPGANGTTDVGLVFEKYNDDSSVDSNPSPLTEATNADFNWDY
jgi:prepilin-type N-terminal cleavage/methylation domain-containing protein